MRARLDSRLLRSLIRDSRISQNHWALRLGISRGHLSDLVNGRHRYPSERVRERMLEVLGVPFAALFAVEDDDGRSELVAAHDGPGRDVRALASIAFDSLAGEHRGALPPAVAALRRRSRRDDDAAFASPETFVRALADALDAPRGARPRGRSAGRGFRRTWSMDGIRRDLRFALRTLARSPGFVGVVTLTLALGVAANAVIFALVDGVLVRPLPFPEDDRLVLLREEDPEGRGMWASYANFADWRAGTPFFDAMAATTWPQLVTVPGSEGPERASVARVSADYFRVTGLEPHRGRFIAPRENRPGGPAVAVVSHAFWHRVLGGRDDPAGVGLPIHGEIYQVVGVAPPGLALIGEPDVWLPLDRAVPWTTRGYHVIPVIGRLRPGVDPAVAHAALDAVGARIAETHAGETVAVGVAQMPFKQWVVGTARQPLGLLMAGAALLLAVACANVASSLLARGMGRRRELAVRAALGAGRGRLLRQLLTETVVLAALGAAAGTLAAVQIVAFLRRAAPASLPRLDAVAIDARTLLFTLGVTALSVLLFGLLPALPLVGRRTAAIRGGALRSRHDHRQGGHWRLLIGAQVAVALVLLTGAGLLAHSLWRIVSSDVGYRAEGVLTATVDLPEVAVDQRGAVYRRLVEALEDLPEVAVAGLASHLPLDAGNFVGPVRTIGVDDGPVAHYRIADAGYFQALGIPLLRGRLLDARDRAGTEHAVVVNRSMAERYWPGRDPLGEALQIDGMDPYDRPLRVVGVVGEARHWRLEPGGQLAYYVALDQRPAIGRTLHLVMRAEAAGAAFTARARDTLRAVAPSASFSFEPLARRLADSTADRRLAASVLAAFGLVALVLAAAGIYGVFTYAVVQRRREMGIRLALGALPAQLMRLVLGDAARTLAWGLTAGLAGALAFNRLIRHQLFGTSPLEPAVLAAAVACLAATGMLASWLPAVRARRVDPVREMRAE